MGSRAVKAVLVVVCCFLALPTRAEVGAKLKEGLSSQSPKVRIVAVAGIANSKDPSARSLIEPLLQDGDEAVRASVIEALGRLGDPAAIPALEKLKSDTDTTVQQVLNRVLPQLDALRIPIYLGKSEDKSGASIDGLGDRLLQKTRAAIEQKLGAIASIGTDASKKSFGASPLIIRSISQRKDGPNTFLDVKCELTLVEMPQQILRAALSTTASVGVPGAISPKMQSELARDAIDACAPDLADDFVSYAKQHSQR
jgi:hypothetical protein